MRPQQSRLFCDHNTRPLGHPVALHPRVLLYQEVMSGNAEFQRLESPASPFETPRAFSAHSVRLTSAGEQNYNLLVRRTEMNTPAPDRAALDTLWQQRLNDARMRVVFSRIYAQEILQDFISGQINEVVEQFSFRQAYRVETFALRKFRQVLQIYSDLTVKGVIPDEAEWLRGNACEARESVCSTQTAKNLSAPDRKALEEIWLKRLKEAGLKLTAARKNLKEIQRDSPPDRNPDGHYAYEKALCAENAALAEHKRMLEIFSDLFLHGKIPSKD